MHLSIRSKMLLYIVLPILFIYALFTAYSLFNHKSLIIDSTKKQMSKLAVSYANKFDSHLREVAMVAKTTAKFVEHHPKLTEDEIYTILKDNVLQNSLIYGGVISFEPFAYDSNLSLFCPYVYRGKDGVNQESLKYINLASTGFDYTQKRWEWWHTPRNTSKSIWTEPYFDDGAGNILMATYATAFNKNSEFYGVTTIDIPLEHLKEKLNLGNDENIRFSVLTSKGTYVFNTNKELINQSIYKQLENSNAIDLKNYADTILSNKTGFFKVDKWNNRTNQWLFYTSIPSAGWSLIIEVDHDYIFTELYKQMKRDALFAFVLLIILFLIIFYISRHFSRPIVKLTALVRKMTKKGSHQNSLKSYDEIAYLTNSFIAMSKSIDEKVSTVESQNQALLHNKEGLEEFNNSLEIKVDKQTKELTKQMHTLSKYVIYSRTDLKGKITDVSDAFCEISGYSRDELIGKPHSIVRHPDTPPSMFQNVWDLIKTGKTWQGEIKDLNKDGSYFWVFADIAPEFSKNGKKKGYISIKHDITAKKDFEKQHLQLLESAKMASMGEMIGNIAHQWRQPLNTISVIISDLQLKKELKTLNDENFNKGIENINKNIQYLSETIDTFRNFIREKKEFKEVVLQKRINIALSIIAISLKDNRIELKNNIDYNHPIKISIIVGELSEVIINIINNAKDILIERKIQNPWIELDLKLKNNQVIITIEDNGGGVADDIMPKIFEPYFTTKHQSQGTGIGLHMSYKIIIESLKGNLYAKNTKNGAKFFIELPLDKN